IPDQRAAFSAIGTERHVHRFVMIETEPVMCLGLPQRAHRQIMAELFDEKFPDLFRLRERPVCGILDALDHQGGQAVTTRGGHASGLRRRKSTLRFRMVSPRGKRYRRQYDGKKNMSPSHSHSLSAPPAAAERFLLRLSCAPVRQAAGRSR